MRLLTIAVAVLGLVSISALLGVFSLSSRADDLEFELSEAKAEAEQANAANDDLSRALDETKDEVSSLESKVEDLEAELENR